MSLKKRFTDDVYNLQEEICRALEQVETNAVFREDLWDREGGGGGRTRIIEKGDVIEKGGVNVSAVHGELPEAVKTHFRVERGWFYASGLSLVIHPLNPMAPAVHANFRFFELYEDAQMIRSVDRWFGGGADLTPFYLRDEDAIHFHRALKAVCDQYGKDLYPRFKKECDEYFYNSHRGEARGVGGIFFDYLRENDEYSDDQWYAFTSGTGNQFLKSYLPILIRRMNEPYNAAQRYWQEIRRGRYAEFNLIHDRGTLFGLKTKGRIESIFMSLPPRVRWDYDFNPEPGSREAYLLERLARPADWIGQKPETGQGQGQEDRESGKAAGSGSEAGLAGRR
ncbi:MAG: oxygen-dependent coproporphyrinogen oxidase [Balneolaceae bacterium]